MRMQSGRVLFVSFNSVIRGSKTLTGESRESMLRRRFNLDESMVVVQGCSRPGDLVIAECKGWGHPDTLADHLAERLSRVYSKLVRTHLGG